MGLYPVITYILPFHIYLPDGIYDVILAGKTHQIRVAFLANPKTSNTQLTLGGEDLELDHDIWGRTGNSEFTVLINEPVTKSTLEAILGDDINADIDSEFNTVGEEKQYLLIDEAIKIGNRLLEVYRDQDLNSMDEPSFHIMPVTSEDVSNITLSLVDENHAMMYHASIPYAGMWRPNQRSNTVIQTIRDFLKNETPIPVSRILTRQAEYSLWRGDYRLVPIEINTVFEMTVDTVLDDYTKTGLSQNNKPELLMGKLKTIQKLSNDYRKSMGKPEIKWFTAKNWEELKKFKGVADYRQEIINWLIDCYKLRNEAVHQGSFTVTQSQAKAALDSTKKAILFLQTLGDI